MRREMGQVFKDGFTNMEFRLEKEDVCYDINFIVQYMIFDTVFCEERNKTRSLDLSRVRRHFLKSQADRQMNRLKHLKRPLNLRQKQLCDKPMDRQMDRQTDGQTDRGQTDQKVV